MASRRPLLRALRPALSPRPASVRLRHDEAAAGLEHKREARAGAGKVESNNIVV